jgi:serine/threonine protein kinase
LRFCGHCGTQVSDPHVETVLVPPGDEGEDLLRRVRHVFAGEYEIESEVGRGGMGVVYKAKEVSLHRDVALKVLPPELGITVKAVERFKREGRLVADLDHPNITPVYRAGQVGGMLHIAMKYVEGRTLDAILEQQGPLPVPVVLAVLRAATRALAYAHERGIVHRDVKGANILIGRNGRIMMTDFGVALRASDITLTQAGTLIGTPAFMSPEQCAGKRALPQSDQYSVGVLAFQMLAGTVPFSAESLAGLIQHHFFTLPPDVKIARDDVPPELVEIVDRSLRKDPADRFLSTRDMVAAVGTIPFGEEERRASEDFLRAVARGESLLRVTTRELPPLPDQPTMLVASAAPAAPAAPAPPKSSLWRRVAAASAVLVAIIAAVAVWRDDATEKTNAAQTAESSSAIPIVAAAEIPALPRPESAPPSATFVEMGRLRLLTAPPDAEILVDGRRAGVGSLFDHPVPTGARRIVVRAPGYRSFDTTVVVGVAGTLNLRLVALATEGDPE